LSARIIRCRRKLGPWQRSVHGRPGACPCREEGRPQRRRLDLHRRSP